jgi:hypothetical protein
MPWWERLDRETRRELRDRYPGRSLDDELAMDAMQDPRFAAEFAQLGAEIETYEEHEALLRARVPGLIVVSYPPEAFPRLYVPEGADKAFADLVVDALLADETPARTEVLAGRVLDVLEQRERSTEHKRGAKPKPVSKGTKQKVAELRIDGGTVAEIMRQTKLTKTIATRLVGDVDAVLGQLRAGRY